MYKNIKAIVVSLTMISAQPAAAEMEVSVYSGLQTLPHSTVDGSNAQGPFSRHVKWEGKSLEPPPYWGARVMWWRDEGIGIGVEVTHTKAYMSAVDRAALGFDRMEFSDGHNLITANIGKRWDRKLRQFSPYLMAGLGFAIPHVDAFDGTNRTFGYQYAGPVVRLTAGAKYELNEKWAAFGEYQFTASENSVNLEGGGELNSRLFTNAINIGLSLKL